MTTPQPTPPSNRQSFDDYAKTAELLGADEGKSKDSQIKFLLQVAEGGYLGTLDLSANKHGTTVDDATKLVEAYAKGRSSSVVFDAKSMNNRVRIAEARTGIKLGGWPKGGNGEPQATWNNLMSLRQNLAKKPAEAKKLDDARNVFLRYARTQLKRDTLIEADELKSFCYKPGKDLLSAEQIIEKTVKQLDKLIDGSASNNTAQNNSNNIKNARQSLRSELAAIATARGKAKGPNPPLKVV